MIPLDALSFQLYSARSLASPEEQFDLLAGLGYRMVEPYGAFLDDPDRFKRLLERYRMTAPTAHIGLDRLRADARAVARQCRELGIGFAFAPAPPPDERDKDAAGWRSLGREPTIRIATVICVTILCSAIRAAPMPGVRRSPRAARSPASGRAGPVRPVPAG